LTRDLKSEKPKPDPVIDSQIVAVDRPSCSAKLATMPPKLRKLLFASLLITVFAGLALCFTSNRTPPRSSLPNPNGYDDFLIASLALSGDVGNFRTLDHDRLRELVLANAETLRRLRLGLTRRCAVPIDSALTNFNGMMSDLPRLKSLALLLAAEGRLAEMENRPVDAALSYADAIHFGNEISRGGFIINRLVGIACEAIGFNPLANSATTLKSEQAQQLIAKLERIDNARVTWDEVLLAEKAFARHEAQTPNPIMWLSEWWQSRSAKQKAEEKHKKMVARLRLLTSELALRFFQSEEGQGPARLEHIVPKHLQHVPIDPFSGQPVVYRVQGTNWLVYSVGVDGADDGGKPVGRSVSGTLTKGDLFFDSPW